MINSNSRHYQLLTSLHSNLKYSLSFVLALSLSLITTSSFAGAGDLDLTFGNGGMVSNDFVTPGQTWKGRAMAVQKDRKILIVGGGPAQLFLARLNANGSLDETFGVSGKSTLDLGTWDDDAYAVTTQPDSKIIVGGLTKSVENHSDFVLIRYNQDGTRDFSFGENGVVIIDFGSFKNEYTIDNIKRVFVQPNGRILALGSTTYSESSIQGAAIVGLRPDGRIDSSYGHGGKVFFSIDSLGLKSNHPIDYEIQSSGRVVALFRSVFPGNLTKYSVWAGINLEGQTDVDFGNNGIVILPDFNAINMALYGDDSILALGTSSSYGKFLVRIKPDGSLDNSFGSNGLVPFPETEISFNSLNDMTIKADGKVVFIGMKYGTEPSDDGTYSWIYIDIAAIGLTAEGALDQSFGTNGVMVFPFDTVERRATPYQVIVLDDKRIAILGEFEHFPEGIYAPREYSIVVAVTSNEGIPDPGFGSEGKAIFEIAIIGTFDGALATVVTQPDGKIIIAGQGGGYGRYGIDFLLARYLDDGSLDQAFGTSGYVITDFRTARDPRSDSYNWSPYAIAYDDVAHAIALQPDGKIVVGGYSQEVDYSSSISDTSFALARYLEDGSLDPEFGELGKVVLDFVPDVDYLQPYAKIQDIFIQPDGKIVAVGYARNRPGGGPYEYAVAITRLNPDGSFDSSFGNDGKLWLNSLLVNQLNGYHSFAYTAALQRDGRIVVGGYYTKRRPWIDDGGFLIFRINPNGTLDEAFGTGGLITEDIDHSQYRSVSGSSSSDDILYDLVIRPNGKILAGGSAYMGDTAWDMVLAQYNEDGTLDPAFADNGILLLDYNRDLSGVLPRGTDVIQALVLQDDGRVVAGGYTGHGVQMPKGGRLWRHSYYPEYAMTIMRIDADGSLDFTFGEGGRTSVSFDQSTYSFAEGIDIQANGRIVAVGYAGYTYNIENCFSEDPTECSLLTTRSNIAIARVHGISNRIDEIEALILQIEDLVKYNQLIAGPATSLLSKLRAALQQMDGGNVKAAQNQLAAFVSETKILANKNTLSQEAAEALISSAEGVLYTLGN